VVTGVVATLQSNSATTTPAIGISSSQTSTTIASSDAVALDQAVTASTTGVLTASPLVMTQDYQKTILDSAFASDPLGQPF